MLSSEQSDRFLLHYNPHQGDCIQQDLILGQASLEEGNLTNKMRKGEQHKTLATIKDNDGSDNINNSEKKIMRKEIERQRRRHMSMLNDSLRSLLPPESIKGKRSASDNINNSVNYIKNLEKKIQDLCVRRNKLKNLTDWETPDHGNATSSGCATNCRVTGSPYCGDVEIVINSVLREEDLLLSRVLEVVLEEGLDVTSCVSTQTDDGFFHNIHSEVGDLTGVDLLELQQKLNDVIMSRNFFQMKFSGV